MSTETQNHAEFMTVLASDLSDGAKLAAIAELLGAKSATDVAKTLNKPLRSVERHYAELRRVRKSAGTQNCVDTQKCVPEVRKSAESDTQICVVETRAPASNTTCATKEIPSVLLNYEDSNITPLPPSPSKTPTKRGTRLDPDWELPEAWRQWTRLNFIQTDDATVTAEAEQFRDFWISKTGPNATKLDWQATWRNWCRNSKAIGNARNPKPFNPGRMAYDEQRAAKLSKAREILNSKILEASVQ